MKNSPQKFIQVNGEALPYRVERRRVRYSRLEFNAYELLVILPMKGGDETKLLEEKKRWISKNHAQIRNAIEKLGGGKSNGLPILGDFFELRETGRLKVDFDAKVIEYDPSDGKQLRRLGRILKRKLLGELEPAVEEYSRKLGVGFNRITVRKMRSKWASCSSNGNLSFNLRLICLPREIIRYLACHEVAHLKEKKHGDAFWAIMEREFSNYGAMEIKLFEYWFFVQTLKETQKIVS